TKACEVIYKGESVSMFEAVDAIYAKLSGVFPIDTLSDLIHYNQRSAQVSWGSENKTLSFIVSIEEDNTSDFYLEDDPFWGVARPIPAIYLPAQEFLSINPGFIATYQRREL